MKQTVLTDIELDVQELKYLVESFSQEPTRTLTELLKRNIMSLQGRLDELLQEVESVCDSDRSSFIPEENSEPDTQVEQLESVVIDEFSPAEDMAVKPVVLGESIKLSAGGLRHSISLNDSFRFSRELFEGDTGLMNRVIEQISVMSSYKTALVFLASKVEIDEENEAVNDFLELLKKYFNQSA